LRAGKGGYLYLLEGGVFALFEFGL
jgi:hypothetical protein